jgi:hypothetical protein
MIFTYIEETEGIMATKKKTSSADPEQVGFHKGALTTLAKERQELTRILAIVEQLMQMHLKALGDMGVDLAKEAKKSKKLEEVLK